MYNELLKIGPFTIYGYGLMIAIGILAAYFAAEYRARKKQMPYEEMISLLLWCVIGGFASAKILYWMTQWKEILQNPGFVLETLGDGFVVYGGIIGGILAGFLYCKMRRLKFLQFFDLVMPSVALAQGFGRIGCFLAGCCYGKETQCFLSVVFQNSLYAPNGIPLIPTQIYSALLDFLHAGILIFFSEKLKKDGQTAALYLIFYSAGRFMMEFLRGDLERGSIGSFSTSQFIAVFLFLAGLFLFLFLNSTAIHGKYKNTKW